MLPDGPLPTFFVLGAQKAATTTLARLLAVRADVFMCEPKEPHYFSFNWDRGESWYRSLFAAAGGAAAIGEASTSYTSAPLFDTPPSRIAERLPEARFVYLVREPVQRVRSAYIHALSRGWEHRAPDAAVRENPYYVDLTRYRWQLDPYLQRYDRDRFLVMTTDELRLDAAAAVERVLRFIGAGTTEPVRTQAPVLNRSQDRRIPRIARMAPLLARLPARARRFASPLFVDGDPQRSALRPDTERFVVEAVRDDVLGLREFLGAGFDGWGHYPDATTES